MGWPFGDSVTSPGWCQYLINLGQASLGGYLCSESASNIWHCFSYCRIHRSSNQGVEMEVTSFFVMPSDSREKILSSLVQQNTLDCFHHGKGSILFFFTPPYALLD